MLNKLKLALWASRREDQIKDGKKLLKSDNLKDRLKGAKKFEDVYNNRDSDT